jgi:hypothetical protein
MSGQETEYARRTDSVAGKWMMRLSGSIPALEIIQVRPSAKKSFGRW